MQPMEGAVGEVVGDRYVLKRKLGRGGFGTVWEAADLQSNQSIALKLIHRELKKNPHVLARFEREAQALAKLEHPCLVRSFGWSTAGERPYLAMAFVPGSPLAELHTLRVREGKRLAVEEILVWTEQIASALDYAHGQGLVHRDLKPGNVMVKGSKLKLLDFGIARFLFESADRQTTVGRVLGSIFYMAPEQARGEHVDHRADIFSLGSLIFTLISDRRAWARNDDNEPLSVTIPATTSSATRNHILSVLERLQSAPRPSPSRYREGLDPAVDDVVCQAMAARPEERQRSAGELARALKEALLSSPRPLSITRAQVFAESEPDPEPGTVVMIEEETPPAEAEVPTETRTELASGAGPDEVAVLVSASSRRRSFAVGLGVVASGLIVLGGLALLEPPQASVSELEREVEPATTSRVPGLPTPPKAVPSEPPRQQSEAESETEAGAEPKKTPKRTKKTTRPKRGAFKQGGRDLRKEKASGSDTDVARASRPVSPARTKLEAILQTLEANPGNAPVVGVQVRSIRQLLKQLPGTVDRKSMERCLAMADISSNANDAARCARKLLRTLSGN